MDLEIQKWVRPETHSSSRDSHTPPGPSVSILGKSCGRPSVPQPFPVPGDHPREHHYSSRPPLAFSCLDFGVGQSYPCKPVAQWRRPHFSRPPFPATEGACTLLSPRRGRKYRPHYRALAFFPVSVEGKCSCEQLPLLAPRGSGGFFCWSGSPKPVSTTRVSGLGSYIIQNPFPLEIFFPLFSYHVSSPLCIALPATCQFLVFKSSST